MSENLTEELELSVFSLSVYDDGVAVATLDVPGQPFNTLSDELKGDFEKIIEHCETESRVRALVLASGKPTSFIVGADVKLLDVISTQSEATERSRSTQRLMSRLEDLHLSHDKPVVAAIHGPALGGGLEVALACSLRVISDSNATVLGFPEVKLGLLPGAGGTQRAPRLIGIANALEMILTGKNIRARRARKLGLVDEVVPEPILVETACELALRAADGKLPAPKSSVERLADADYLQQVALEENVVGQRFLFRKAREDLLAKTRGNYPAPELALDAVRIGIQEGLDAGHAAEADRFGRLVVSPESKALRSIFFAETALKKDSGVDVDVDVAPVKRIGVLGGGLMGGGIAFVSATRARVPARIKEVNASGMRRGLRYVERAVAKDAAKKRMSAFDTDRTLSYVRATTEWSGFTGTDIVIEAVYEDLELKQEMLRQVEKHGGPKTIFASNTSSIPISDIAAAGAHPERVVGMHYFSPVEKMPLLEVVTTAQTADWVTATSVAAGKAQGKTVIVVRDGPGFYTSRILAPYMNEAAWLFAEGASLELVDSALVDFGFPVGPITLLDEVGIDVGAKVAGVMTQAFGERMAVPGAMSALLEDQRFGRKNGRGFFRYEKGKKEGIDPSVYGLIGGKRARVDLPVEEIQERLVLQMVNEAARCLEEGILRSARDGDIGAVFGLGFPPFLGGPFSYIDRYGAGRLVGRLEQLAERHGERFAPTQLLLDHAESNKAFRA
ncbi:MAG: fatty acid oxidation complex subunit alpha FadJ [Myxococcota bacterium]